MNFPFFVAKRYLVSKKSQNAINWISGIAVLGVGVSTAALIIVMSFFNGMEGLVKTLYNAFNPDLEVTAQVGKTFSVDSATLLQLRALPEISAVAEVLEENALVQYRNKQYIATIKGVDSVYNSVTGVDSMLIEGQFTLQHNGRPFAVVGAGVAYHLGIGLNFMDPLKLFLPNRKANFIQNPEKAFKQQLIYPSGKFSIQPDFDSKYIFVPLHIMHKLLGYQSELSGLEIKLKDAKAPGKVKEQVKAILGDDLLVRDRQEQNASLFKMMQTEKWVVFFILVFILIIASFNVIGSLSMIIIDKKGDIALLQSLGADRKRISAIFFFDGLLVSFSGALMGLLVGYLFCLAQTTFGIIRFPSAGTFIVDAYPVELMGSDFLYIFGTVVLLGAVVSWYPVKVVMRKYLA